MTFALSQRSLDNMAGIHPVLHDAVCEAITITPVDFGILESGGVRTEEEQAELVRKGASWTMNSLHRIQSDGYGHAVDLVPYVAGAGFRWEWPLIYPIAATMRHCTMTRGLVMIWGGVWDRTMDDLATGNFEVNDDARQIKAAVREYCVRHPGPDRIDGPHYQIERLP